MLLGISAPSTIIYCMPRADSAKKRQQALARSATFVWRKVNQVVALGTGHGIQDILRLAGSTVLENMTDYPANKACFQELSLIKANNYETSDYPQKILKTVLFKILFSIWTLAHIPGNGSLQYVNVGSEQSSE